MSLSKVFSIFFPESAKSFLESFKFQGNSSFEYSQENCLHIETLNGNKKQIIVDFKTKPTDLKLYSSKSHTARPNLNNNELRNMLINNVADFHIHVIEAAKEAIRLESLTEVKSDLKSEAQGLEWLRVSIEVLKKGIQHCLANEDLLYQQTVFLKENKLGSEIRISVLSLDFKIVFLRDSRLEITCWNFKDSTDKSGEHTPAFKGHFYHQKNQVFDLFIPLIKQMSQASTMLKEL